MGILSLVHKGQLVSDRLSVRAWAVLVFAAALLVRLGTLLLYGPARYADTKSYYRLATAIQNGLKGFDGTRTPGYPLYLALTKTNTAAWVGQLFMGLVITLLIFYMGYLLSGKAWLAGAAALTYTINLQQVFFESTLLTETLTTLWVMLACAGVFTWMLRPNRRSLLLAAGIGLSAGLAFLTRPLFIYLPFFLVLFLAFNWKQGMGIRQWLVQRLNYRAILALLLPAVLIMAGWVGFVHQRYGIWALNTMTGFHLVQHTGAFFEYVPDQYAHVRDTYLRYRNDHIAKYGTQTNAIWEAIPELQVVSGKSFLELSALMAKLSVQLILAHPDLYLKGVIQGWFMFWYAPVYWQPDLLRWSWLVVPLKGAILLERILMLAANFVFLLTGLLYVFWKRFRQAIPLPAVLVCLAGNIWIASIAQTFMDHGDNPRFLVPLQPLVILCVLWLFWELANLLQAARRDRYA